MAEIIKLFLSATKMTVSFIKNKICTYVRDEKRTRKKKLFDRRKAINSGHS